MAATASTQLDGRADSQTPDGQQQSTFPNVVASRYAYESSTDGIVAHSGGGQANAVPLTTQMNRVITVAAANDSVVLPPSQKGLQITVTNAAAANSLNIFPSAAGTTTEAINGLGANAAFALTAAKTVTFACYTAGLWHTIPLVP
jgi:hypothetical protein